MNLELVEIVPGAKHSNSSYRNYFLRYRSDNRCKYNYDTNEVVQYVHKQFGANVSWCGYIRYIDYTYYAVSLQCITGTDTEDQLVRMKLMMD